MPLPALSLSERHHRHWLRYWRHRASLPTKIARLETTRDLISSVKLCFHSATDLEGRNGRPDAPLALENPVLKGFFGWHFHQAHKVAGCDFGNERHASTGNSFIDQKAADARGKEL